jgi:hypothetical protein
MLLDRPAQYAGGGPHGPHLHSRRIGGILSGTAIGFPIGPGPADGDAAPLLWEVHQTLPCGKTGQGRHQDVLGQHQTGQGRRCDSRTHTCMAGVGCVTAF